VEEASAAYLKAKADVAAGVRVVGSKSRAATEARRFAAAAREALWAAHEARRGLPKHVYAKGRKYVALIWDRVQKRNLRLGTFDTVEKARKSVERAKKGTPAVIRWHDLGAVSAKGVYIASQFPPRRAALRADTG
jgi:hypothetical protein